MQRQLAVKNDRIKQLRQALESASSAGASFSPAPSRPGSAAGGRSGDALVLRQKLEAATAAADNLRALNRALEGQLSEAQQAQRAVQAQLAAATRRLAALFDAAELGSGSEGSGTGSAARPSSAGDAGGVLVLQVRSLLEIRVGEATRATAVRPVCSRCMLSTPLPSLAQ